MSSGLMTFEGTKNPSRGDTPPIDPEYDEEIVQYDIPIGLVKYKTSPNPYTRSLSNNEEFEFIDSLLKQQSIQDKETIYCGLCLILLFECPAIEIIQARVKSKQIKQIFTSFNFEVKILDFVKVKDERLGSFTNMPVHLSTTSFKPLRSLITEEIISSVFSGSLIVFLIGQAVINRDSRSILSYSVHECIDQKLVHSHPSLIHTITHFARLRSNMPVLFFFNYIPQLNSPYTPEKNVSTNTCIIFISNSQSSLPHDVISHRIVLSLLEALRELPMQSQLLDLLLITRDNYFKSILSANKFSFSTNAFYIKNTLYNPFYLHKNSNFQTNFNFDGISRNPQQGLFMVVSNDNLSQDKYSLIAELIKHIKSEFESFNFKIAQDILLVGKSSYSQMIGKNKLLCQNCSSVVVLVLTHDLEHHQVSLKDKTFLKINVFTNELANSFPNIPKVLFLSQLIVQQSLEYDKKTSIDCINDNYQNIFIVHAIDKTMLVSNSSFLANLIHTLAQNYFVHLHSIIQSATNGSYKSDFIQVVDGLNRNFYFRSNIKLSSECNMDNEQFKRAYELACLEGSEPFRFFRLMIVGPEGVGKTSLLHHLIGLPFQDNQESTPFLNKFDLQVHKISDSWDQIEDLNTYAKNLEATKEDMVVKFMTQGLLDSDKTLSNQVLELNSTNENYSNYSIDQQKLPSHFEQTLSSKLDFEYKSDFDPNMNYDNKSNRILDEQVHIDESNNVVLKVQATLRGSEELKSKSDFLTAWDFAGQTYLYCFHSLFLSPRAIYLLLIDLTVEELTHPINVRTGRLDRHDLRSQIGVPTTYLQAIEFWMNAIFSVSKSASSDIYQRPAKILFIFSKCDCVINPVDRAKKHIETIRSHMNKRNNSFSLVHEDDGIFLISCIPESPFSSKISLLKDTIKNLSDQIAYQQSIPIKWMELAKVILREEYPVLSYKRIYYLAESCQCAKDLEYFLHLFHDIGFFYFKQDKIINNVQQFLNLIYNIVSPQYRNDLLQHFPKKDNLLFKRDLEICQNEAKLSCNMLDCILKSLNLINLKDPLFELLKLYGILIDFPSVQGLTDYFYVPYLLKKSFDEISALLPEHQIISSFYIYFPDGFIPASLYFTLLADCIGRNCKKDLPEPKLGFDCAYFYICSYLLVALEYTKVKPYIKIVFSKIISVEEENDFTKHHIKSEVMDYVSFLQILIVDIQGKLIPCGNLAKIVLDCTCGRLSELEQMENPCIFLDQLLLTNSRSRESWCYNSNSKIEWNHYFNDNDFLLDYMTKFYDNTSLAKFIFNHQDIFIKHINSKDLSPLLYKFGLASSERIHAINNHLTSQRESYNLLEELVHKGPLWAIKFYVALSREYTNPGHQFLRSIIDSHITTGFIKPLDIKASSTHNFGTYHDRYRMNSNPHGIAFLINIELFTAEQTSIRKGSKLDLIALRETFEQLQYIVMVSENLTKAEFKREVVRIARLDHSNYDSFFCVVMSHGDENDKIVLADGKKISRDEITSEFSNTYCKSLAGKPKIFIIQACRGSKIEVVQFTNKTNKRDEKLKLYQNITIKSGESLIKKVEIHPTVQPLRENLTPSQTIDEELENLSSSSDTFIGNSSVQRYSSFRDSSKGSMFIQSFCLVLQYCRYEEFLHIMTEVRRRVFLLSQTYTQCTEDISHLTKKLYF